MEEAAARKLQSGVRTWLARRKELAAAPSRRPASGMPRPRSHGDLAALDVSRKDDSPMPRPSSASDLHGGEARGELALNQPRHHPRRRHTLAMLAVAGSASLGAEWCSSSAAAKRQIASEKASEATTPREGRVVQAQPVTPLAKPPPPPSPSPSAARRSLLSQGSGVLAAGTSATILNDVALSEAEITGAEILNGRRVRVLRQQDSIESAGSPKSPDSPLGPLEQIVDALRTSPAAEAIPAIMQSDLLTKRLPVSALVCLIRTVVYDSAASHTSALTDAGLSPFGAALLIGTASRIVARVGVDALVKQNDRIGFLPPPDKMFLTRSFAASFAQLAVFNALRTTACLNCAGLGTSDDALLLFAGAASGAISMMVSARLDRVQRRTRVGVRRKTRDPARAALVLLALDVLAVGSLETILADEGASPISLM